MCKCDGVGVRMCGCGCMGGCVMLCAQTPPTWIAGRSEGEEGSPSPLSSGFGIGVVEGEIVATGQDASHHTPPKISLGFPQVADAAALAVVAEDS